jgi:ketosteroid isomerase-like protein
MSKRVPNHRLLLPIVLMALVPVAGWSGVAAAPQHDKVKKVDYKHQVEQLEEIWRTAQMAGDAGAMDKLLSDDYIGIGMNGQVSTKEQQLDRLRTRAMMLTRMDLDDVKVHIYGTTAVVTSLAIVEGTSDGAPIRGTYRYTRVYSRSVAGIWKITNFEATRVGPQGPPQQRNHPPGSPHID